MMRLFTPFFCMLFLAVIIHFILILFAPDLEPSTFQSRFLEKLHYDRHAQKTSSFVPFIQKNKTKQPFYLYQDPYIFEAFCPFNLSEAPTKITLSLDVDFWSLTLYQPEGLVITSMNDSVSIHKELDLLIINDENFSLLRQNRIDVSEHTIIAESDSDIGFAILRIYHQNGLFDKDSLNSQTLCQKASLSEINTYIEGAPSPTSDDSDYHIENIPLPQPKS